MSGMMAARAICGAPEEIVGETDEHDLGDAFEELSAVEVVGEHKGLVAVLALPKEQVKALVPEGFTLDDVKGRHHVIVTCGERYNTRLTFPSILPSQTYKEVMIAIPSVNPPGRACACGRKGPFLYVAKIYVNNLLVAAGGKAWGIDIANADLRQDRSLDGGTYRWQVIANREPLIVVESRGVESRVEGQVRPLNQFDSFENIRNMLAQPILSSSWKGRLMTCADMKWNLDLALAKKVSPTVRFGGSLLAGALRGKHPSPKIRKIKDEVQDRAIESFALLRHRWRLSAPGVCRLSFLRRSAHETEAGE